MPNKYIKISIFLVLLFGLAYAVTIPPFQAPDEPAHFARAYGIAEGQFVLKDHPRELVEIIMDFLGLYYDIDQHVMFSEINDLLRESGDRIPNIAYNTSQYSFIPYLPHAVLLKLTELFVGESSGILLGLYLTRIINVFFYCLVFTSAIRVVPNMSLIIFWVMATPMAVSQGAIFSTDIIVYSSGLLLLCLGWSNLSLRHYIPLAFFSVFFLLASKPPYAFLLLIALVSALVQKQDRLLRMLSIFTAASLAIATGLLWKEAVVQHGILEHTMKYIQLYRSPDISPADQFKYVLSNPSAFIQAINNTFVSDGWNLFHQMVGVLGWQDLPLPRWVVFFWAIMLFPVLFVSLGPANDFAEKSHFVGISCLISAVLTTSAILLALYLTWMPVGAQAISAQGRYFHLPVLSALGGVLLLASRFTPVEPPGRNTMSFLLCTGTTLVHIAGLIAIINRYWSV
ncbi:DUF2142 domain-containing protein [Desulfonatronovibrio magnus]|uniref:DUF2142 domain-containing protein n=1 Tax=Desulfonatronovibrio magnus TaxID=698827 RepID=UPI0005EB8BD6|nr:DUF2142 domain-containing protein [Desulfonatronovibrio magnus]